MTSSEISSVKGGFSTATAGTTAAASTKKTEKAAEAFAGLMNAAGGYVQNQQIAGNSQQITAPVVTDAGKSSASKIKQASDPATKISEKLSDKQEAVSDDVKNMVAKDLDVTEEEVDAAMEQLGLTVFDLFDPQKLVSLTMELTDTTDSSALLMNEGFVDLMQQVNDLMSQLADQLGVSVEDLQNALTSTEFLVEPEIAAQLQEISPEQTMTVSDSAATEETMQAAGTVSDAVIRQPEEQMAGKDITAMQPDTDEAAQSATVEVTNETQPDTGKEAQTDDSDAGQTADTQTTDQPVAAESKTETDGQNMNAAHLFGRATEQTMQVQPQTVTPQVQTAVDVADIMNQIAEFVRVNVSQETASIEMQLNPENLGKVYLQISSSKEGNVTAQLAAQNEAVKEVLETQVAELRQTLSQQGVKVDAIEVTVASHEFEQNLEQQAESEKRQGEEQEQARPARRSLSRDSLDELSGLMSEEEAIAAQIMKDNGNSMDVIA